MTADRKSAKRRRSGSGPSRSLPKGLRAAAEKATRLAPPGDLREARRVFREDLSQQDKLRLVEEIVRTRAGELCRAYKNVIALAHGYRKKRPSPNAQARVRATACVTFIVSRKWEKGENERTEEKLPKFLFAYWTIDGERRLVAVPTDVDDARGFADVEPLAASAGVNVKRPPPGATRTDPGAIACALQRSTLPQKTFVLSCRHVFHADPSRLLGAKVSLATSGEEIATARGVMGKLENDVQFSLDAQLADLGNPAALKAAWRGLQYSDYVSSSDQLAEIPDRYVVLTPRDQTVAVKRSQIIRPWPLSYGPGRTRVIHEEVLELQVVSGTIVGGDSGSPVFATGDSAKLVGMLFASQRATAFAVPAWQLFRPANYKGALKSEVWTLVDADALEVPPPVLGSAEVSATSPSSVANDEPSTLSSDSTVPPALAGDRLSLLKRNHNFNGGVNWRLSADGLRVNNRAPEVTQGQPATVQRVWREFGSLIRRVAQKHGVPVELIIATICTETTGNPAAIRKEPGYVSDATTPHRISVGLMQTLISTAREALGDRSIDRSKLLDPEVAVGAGTAYIAQQASVTGFDPPKVACAYNAGSVRANNGAQNRWKMRQFRIGTGEHADRFVKWFNDCFRFFGTLTGAHRNQVSNLGGRSFWVLLNT